MQLNTESDKENGCMGAEWLPVSRWFTGSYMTSWKRIVRYRTNLEKDHKFKTGSTAHFRIVVKLKNKLSHHESKTIYIS